MKRVVADLVVGTHAQDGLASGLDGSAAEIAVCQSHRSVGIRSFWCKVSGQLLPDDLCRWRLVVSNARQTHLQRAFARDTHFTTNRVIVVQLECAQAAA